MLHNSTNAHQRTANKAFLCMQQQTQSFMPQGRSNCCHLKERSVESFRAKRENAPRFPAHRSSHHLSEELMSWEPSAEDLNEMSHIHTQDESDMLAALRRMPQTKSIVRQTLQVSPEMSITGPSLPEISKIPGTYHIGPDANYILDSFQIKPQDIILPQDSHPLLDPMRDRAVAHKYGRSLRNSESNSGSIAAHIILRKSQARFRPSLLSSLIQQVAREVVYVITVSENGICRFHLPPDLWMATKLLFLAADSEQGLRGCFKNIQHVKENGCFCLGMFFETSDNQTLLMRFNRWGDQQMAPFWAAANDHNQD